ncbi:MAG: hypothetical protein K6A38_07870 [Lachnospiraceae bacterium]|nr:hypothetical protein [Lachnospiraceae bacterium]
MKDYRLLTKNIIKWYEYKMCYPGEETEDENGDIPDTEEVQKSLEEMSEDEEIDLSTTGLGEDEQALVEDILARFKEAKQNTVDDLFAGLNDEPSSEGESAPMSEEDLIAAICAPKQNNVDALVNEAYSGM